MNDDIPKAGLPGEFDPCPDTAGEALVFGAFVALALAVCVLMFGWLVAKALGLWSAAFVLPAVPAWRCRDRLGALADWFVAKACPSWLLIAIGFDLAVGIVALCHILQWRVLG